MTDARRGIPGVDSLLGAAEFGELIEAAGRDRVATLLRAVQAELRATMGGSESGTVPPGEAAWYAAAVAARMEASDRPTLRGVINATGVVLHTNLGRAPLAAVARQAVADAAGYATVEYDLDTGARGSRHDHAVDLLRELTGAEAALVVNNNAAAVVLALNSLAAGAEAVISRGELVEIGGSFRIPEIMAWSGVRMREVGATNRTHLRDYERAIGSGTGLILKVHRSNFRVEGFVSEVGVPELGRVARARGLPVVHDLGSGALVDLTVLGLPAEPTARTALAAGADVVTMSGDKLLGGPQAGIILGSESLVERMRHNPLLRAVRCDKLTLAALEATLRLYGDPDRAFLEIPVLRMLAEPAAALEARAGALAARLQGEGVAATVAPGFSAVGGGAYPGTELPTTVVAVEPGPAGAESLAGGLRAGDPPVVARVRDGLLLLDPRTVDPSQEDVLVAAMVAVCRDHSTGPGG
jgi:L-seryl-tRNA(Ser) seleniumtransferase